MENTLLRPQKTTKERFPMAEVFKEIGILHEMILSHALTKSYLKIT